MTQQLVDLVTTLPVDPLLVRPQWPTMDTDETIAAINRLGKEVVPALRSVEPRTIPVMRTYTDLRPTFPDRSTWTLAQCCGLRAAEQPDATYLVTPEERRQWTYAETLAAAESVCGGPVCGGRADR